MPLSYWADYLSMVAQQTNHTAAYVWSQLSYARGLQFRTIWFEAHGYEVEKPGASISPLRRRIL